MGLVEDAHLFLEKLKERWCPNSSQMLRGNTSVDELRNLTMLKPNPPLRYTTQHYNAAKRANQSQSSKSPANRESRSARACGERVQAWCSWSPYINDDVEMVRSLQVIHPAKKDTLETPQCHRFLDNQEDVALHRHSRRRVFLSITGFNDTNGAPSMNHQKGVKMCLHHGDPTLLPRKLTNNPASASNTSKVINSLYPYRRRGEPSDESSIPCKNYNNLHKHRTFAEKLDCDEQAGLDDSMSSNYLKPVTPINIARKHNDYELPAINTTPEPESHPLNTVKIYNNGEEEPSSSGSEEPEECREETDNEEVEQKPPRNSDYENYNQVCWTTTDDSDRSLECHNPIDPSASDYLLPVSTPTRQSSAGSFKYGTITPSLTTMQQYVEDKFAAPQTQSGLRLTKQAQLIESLLLYQHRRISPEKTAAKQLGSINRTQSLLSAPDIRRTTAQMLKHQSPVTPNTQANPRQYFARSRTQTTVLPRVPQSGSVTSYGGRSSKPIGATVKLDRGTTAGMITVPHIGLYWKLSKNE